MHIAGEEKLRCNSPLPLTTTPPFFGWGTDLAESETDRVNRTIYNTESDLRTDVLKGRLSKYGSSLLMKSFNKAILTDRMREADELSFIQDLAEIDQQLGDEPKLDFLDGLVDYSDPQTLSSAVEYLEELRLSIYKREVLLQLRQVCSSSAYLFHAFIPKRNESKLALTFWGILSSIKEVSVVELFSILLTG
jgi:hypothetical protein